MANTKTLLDIIARRKSGAESIEQLQAQIEFAKGQADSDKEQFVERFNTAYQYYTGVLPGNMIKEGNEASQHRDIVIPVLYNAVKAALPQQLDAFINDDAVACEFRSRGYRRNPVTEALINYNINKIFLRDQDGYAVMEGMIKTSLIAGDAFAKVYVDETTHRDIATVEDWIDIADFMQGIAEEWTIEPPKDFAVEDAGNIKGFEWKIEKQKATDPQTGEETNQEHLLIKGKIPMINVEKKLVVEEVEPHDIWFDTSYGSDFNKVPYICHRIKTTIGEAELRGFDPEKLKEATIATFEDTELPDLFFSQVNYANPTGSLTHHGVNYSVDEKQRPINLYEHYIYSSLLTRNNETRLYQVVSTGKEILAVNEIKRMPFIHSKCEPIQGSFYSRSFFDIAKPFQDNLSIAARMHFKTAMLSAWPQYVAVKGTYDRQSLLNNTPGQVIEVMQQGAVDRFSPFQLTETFVSAEQSLRDNMLETIAQPVGFQNADGGVPQVATATAYLTIFNESQKAAALTESLKRTLVKPLYTLIYEIIKDEGFILYAPDGSTVSGVELPSVYDFILDTNTTHDDFAYNTQLSNTAAFIAQMSQVNSPIISPQNLYEIAKEMLEKSDIDSSKFLTNPQTLIDPQEMALQKHEEAEMKAIQSELAKVQLTNLALDGRKTASEIYLNEQKAEELIRNGEASRTAAQVDSQAKIAKIQSDAQAEAAHIQVKQFDAETKRNAVNYETILASQKHTTDITTPRINGIR